MSAPGIEYQQPCGLGVGSGLPGVGSGLLFEACGLGVGSGLLGVGSGLLFED